MLDEEVRVEEQRDLVAVHGYPGEAVLHPEGIHLSVFLRMSSSPSAGVPVEMLLKLSRQDIGQVTDIRPL
jgi:hypothetical protein